MNFKRTRSFSPRSAVEHSSITHRPFDHGRPVPNAPSSRFRTRIHACFSIKGARRDARENQKQRERENSNFFNVNVFLKSVIPLSRIVPLSATVTVWFIIFVTHCLVNYGNVWYTIPVFHLFFELLLFMNTEDDERRWNLFIVNGHLRCVDSFHFHTYLQFLYIYISIRVKNYFWNNNQI